MTNFARSEWLVPAGLLALGAIPVLAGSLRLVQLAGAAQITPANARFFAAPLPAVLHIVCASVFYILGALQFSPALLRRKPGWHRTAGRTLIPCGLVAALSALWMVWFYPPVDFDGPVVHAMRLAAASAMAWSLCLGFAAIRRHDIPRHRAWMTRGYALGLGAGTQVLTHLPFFLLPAIQGELTRALCMGAGWGINLAAAEWFLRRRRRIRSALCGTRDS